MPINRKWILTFGILALSPSVTQAGPFGLPSPFQSKQGTAEKPEQAAPSNQQVANQIAAALTEARLTGQDISIEFQNGVAVLEGKIQDQSQKQKATEVVSRLSTVARVDNRLEPMIPDASRAIQQTAFEQPVVPTAPVSQATFQAPAQPTGVSPIQQVAGVQAPSNKTQNQQVANQIAYALRDSGVSGYDIEISFKDGVATLGGSVSNEEQRQYVHAVVSQVPEVRSINNQLSTNAPPAVQTVAFQPGVDGGEAVPGAGGPGLGIPMPGPMMAPSPMGPGPVYGHPGPGPVNPVYNQPYLPDHAWPTYAAYPNYAGVTYPKQYSASAFPYIGPFYPYPQVPLGWRSSTLEWDDGQWQLKFSPRTDRWWWFMNPKNWD
ncbi:MAG: BON domain-containing protein [Planctomycetaceae bacterium]|nr:BON domain-containing protein [Planctomycetaceae bacterium]